MKVNVVSSTISWIEYEGSTLRVGFRKGGVYEYEGVPGKIITEMINAESIGSYFAKNVKNIYKAKKLA